MKKLFSVIPAKAGIQGLIAMTMAMVMVFMFSGCSFIQLAPSKDTARFEIFGENVGVYMKLENPESTAKSMPWVKAVASLSDEDLLSADVIQTAYKYLMENHPEDRNLILLVKSGVDLLGLRIDVSSLTSDETSIYTKNTRAVITGYLKGVM